MGGEICIAIGFVFFSSLMSDTKLFSRSSTAERSVAFGIIRRNANTAPRSGAWLLVMRAKKSCVMIVRAAHMPPIVNIFREDSASLASCKEPGREDGKNGRDVSSHVWDSVLTSLKRGVSPRIEQSLVFIITLFLSLLVLLMTYLFDRHTRHSRKGQAFPAQKPDSTDHFPRGSL